MKVRILGCAGTVSPESKTSAFLINDNVLLDGGTICSSLTIDALKKIQTIFISHPHFDHIKGIPSLVETLIFMGVTSPVTLMASEQAIEAIRSHIMNDIIWPDFSMIPGPDKPVIRYQQLAEGVPMQQGSVTVTPFFLHSNFTDYGYLVQDESSSLLYTSDIGTDASLTINGTVPDSIIIEVSFPNEKEHLALRTGHLTPKLLMDMLGKLPQLPRNIYISHLKTYFKEQILDELQGLGVSNLVILNDGDLLEL